MPLIQLFASNFDAGTTASAIGSQTCTEVMVQAHSSNTVLLLLGNASNQVIELSAGNALVMPVSNVNQVYAKTSSGSARVNWFAHTMELR